MYFYVQLPIIFTVHFLCDRVPDSESKPWFYSFVPGSMLWPQGQLLCPGGLWFSDLALPAFQVLSRITTPCGSCFLIQGQVTNQVLLYLLIWLHLEACGILVPHQGTEPRAHGRVQVQSLTTGSPN